MCTLQFNHQLQTLTTYLYEDARTRKKNQELMAIQKRLEEERQLQSSPKISARSKQVRAIGIAW
jgi:glutamate formiminotransferase